jgi:hypothetical protein
VLPDEDQNRQPQQPQATQPEQPIPQEPSGRFTPPAFDIPIGVQGPKIPQPETGQPLVETPSPGPVVSPGPTMPGPTITGPESGPVIGAPPPPPASPPPPPAPTPVIGKVPKSGGNTMQKIRLLLILIPILILLVIIIFVATSFLGKSKTGKGAKATPTPASRLGQSPTPPPFGPGGFAQTPTPTPALVGGIYRDSTSGFSIEPPTGWTTQGEVGFATFQNPKEDLDATGNKFNANLLISITVLSTGQTFDTYFEQKKNELALLSGYQKINEIKGVLAGGPAFQIDFKWKLGVVDARQRVVGIQKDQKVFLLTATSTAITWDKYQPIFEKSISSFTFSGLPI